MSSLTPEQQSALNQVAEASVAAERETGVPAELSTAQCLIESAWLTRCPGNNCFGIKATDSSETYQVTEEYLNGKWETMKLAFEAYPTLADCFVAHAKLLQGGRYSPAWRQFEEDQDLDALISGIGPIYATAPGYAGAVTALAHGPHVRAAIAAARAS